MNFIIVSKPIDYIMTVKKSASIWLILLLILMADSTSAWWTGVMLSYQRQPYALYLMKSPTFSKAQVL